MRTDPSTATSTFLCTTCGHRVPATAYHVETLYLLAHGRCFLYHLAACSPVCLEEGKAAWLAQDKAAIEALCRIRMA